MRAHNVERMSPIGHSSHPHELPACPNCQSKNTIRTHEQLGEQLFFCPDCEKTWGFRPGKPKVVKTYKN
jgi:transposase-like protein